MESFLLGQFLCHDKASLVAQTAKNLPAVQETQVQSLGPEDPLEKGMATHFSILACHYNLNVGAFDIVPEVSETQFFSFFLPYSALQKLFPPFYLPAH